MLTGKKSTAFVLGAISGIATVALSSVVLSAPVSRDYKEPPPKEPFSDVLPDQYYTEAIKYSERWLRGYDNGLFGVDDPVTRSQLSTVLLRYDLEQERQYESTVREFRKNARFIRDLAALVCLNKRSFLDSVEINSLVPPALGNPEDRYSDALESLCLLNWQQQSDPTVIDPYEFQECHDEVDLRTGQITTVFCYPQ